MPTFDDTAQGEVPDATGALAPLRSYVSEGALAAALASKAALGGSLGLNLVRVGAIDESDFARFAVQRYALPLVDDELVESATGDAIRLLPSEVVSEGGLLPLRVEGRERLIVGVVEPIDTPLLEEVEFFAGLRVDPRIVTVSQFNRAWVRATGVEPAAAPRHAGDGVCDQADACLVCAEQLESAAVDWVARFAPGSAEAGRISAARAIVPSGTAASVDSGAHADVDDIIEGAEYVGPDASGDWEPSFGRDDAAPQHSVPPATAGGHSSQPGATGPVEAVPLGSVPPGSVVPIQSMPPAVLAAQMGTGPMAAIVPLGTGPLPAVVPPPPLVPVAARSEDDAPAPLSPEAPQATIRQPAVAAPATAPTAPVVTTPFAISPSTPRESSPVAVPAQMGRRDMYDSGMHIVAAGTGRDEPTPIDPIPAVELAAAQRSRSALGEGSPESNVRSTDPGRPPVRRVDSEGVYGPPNQVVDRMGHPSAFTRAVVRNLIRTLNETQTADETMSEVASGLALAWPSAIVMSVRAGQLVVWHAAMHRRPRNFVGQRFDVELGDPWERVVRDGVAFRGRLGANDPLRQLVGRDLGRDTLLVPVTIRQRTIAVVVLDAGYEPELPAASGQWEALETAINEALVRILRQKKPSNDG